MCTVTPGLCVCVCVLARFCLVVSSMMSRSRLILSAVLALWACGSCSPGPVEDVLVDSYSRPKLCVREVKKGDLVRYHYNATFTDGRQFDSSYDRGTAFFVKVGDGRQIAGVDKGIVGMCINERRKITVPPHLAYGSQGAGDTIPPDSTLVFDLILLDIFNMADRVRTEIIKTQQNCTRSVMKTDFVRFHFNGSLLDGTHFDSSYDRSQTQDNVIGDGWLIKGLDEGLLGMCVGEIRNFVIPPFLAFGEKGYEEQVNNHLIGRSGKEIPPHATVIYDVLLVDLHNRKDDITVEIQEIPEPCTRKTIIGDYIRYHYNGTFLNGNAFDSSYTHNSTYNTYIGLGYVISGMDKGLQGVCMGERRRIIMPPHLAYGQQGAGKEIPASAVLVFDIHVIDFHNPKDSVQVDVTFKPEVCNETSQVNDYIQYHYNCTLMDGTLLFTSLKFLLPRPPRSLGLPVRLSSLRGPLSKPGSIGLLLQLDGIPYFQCPPLCLGIAAATSTRDLMSTAPDGGVNNGGGEHGPLRLNVPNLPRDLVETLSEVGVEDSPNRGISKTFPTDPHNTFGSAKNDYRVPQDVLLGGDKVINGLDEGLRGMCVGERRIIIIPPHLGHGERGAGIVPGSAVLQFEVELISIQKGIPEGYLFVWLDETPKEIFETLDINQDKEVPLEEFSEFIKRQVAEGKGRLKPAQDPESVIRDMFKNQDRNGDGRITADELKLKVEEDREKIQHEEL
ncbi:hypothetical protein QTP86_026944 [Hemibagrus guttatus]|nr:hypothetical protein QTP86_026944 [Hemibagrus guttatus]